jgi:hypothetical protein
MSENDNTEATASDTETTQETAQETESEFDWKAAARKWETRAKEHKSALDALEANKAALETQLSALTEEAGTKEAAANAALEKANLELLRLKVRAKYGLTEDEQELFLTGSDEETLDKQGEALSKRNGSALKPDNAQGKRTGSAPLSGDDAFEAALAEALSNM